MARGVSAGSGEDGGSKRRKKKRQVPNLPSEDEDGNSTGGRNKRRPREASKAEGEKRKKKKMRKKSALRAWSNSSSDNGVNDEDKTKKEGEREKVRFRAKQHKKARLGSDDAADSDIEGHVRRGKRKRQNDGAAVSDDCKDTIGKKKKRKNAEATHERRSWKRKPKDRKGFKDPKESQRSRKSKASENNVQPNSSADGKAERKRLAIGKSDEDTGRGPVNKDVIGPWDPAKMNQMMMRGYPGYMGMMQASHMGMMMPMMQGLMQPSSRMVPPMMMGLPGKGAWPRGRGARRGGAGLPSDLSRNDRGAVEKGKKRRKKKQKEASSSSSQKSSSSSSRSSSSDGEKPAAETNVEAADAPIGTPQTPDSVQKIDDSPQKTGAADDDQSPVLQEFNIAPATPPEALQGFGMADGRTSPIPFIIAPKVLEPPRPKEASKGLSSGGWQVDFKAPSIEEMQRSLSKEYRIAEVQTEDVTEDAMQDCEARWFVGFGGFSAPSDQKHESKAAPQSQSSGSEQDQQDHGVPAVRLRRRSLCSRSRSAKKKGSRPLKDDAKAADDDASLSSSSSSSSSSSGTPERQRATSSDEEGPGTAKGADADKGKEKQSDPGVLASRVQEPVVSDPSARISRMPCRGLRNYSDLA